MIRKIFLTIALFLTSVSIFAAYPQLTGDAKITMFTCGPGDELYAGFGHSALWIYDPLQKIDRLYNYGTFDFDTPNFYGKFIRGKLDYMLSVTRGSRFIEEYRQRKISVYGQELNLTPNEKQKMFEFMENNLLPENRFYKYDFFYDNCATRIRDVLVTTADGTVDFNTADQSITFRQMLFPYLTHTPWTKFGINMILGLTSDKKAKPWDYMYLPEQMQYAFENATIAKDGEKRRVVNHGEQYLESKLEFTNNKADDPVVVFGLILLVISAFTVIEIKTGKTRMWINRILFTISSLAGLFLVFMWLGTDHIATAQNMNALWLLPAPIIYLVAFRMKKYTGKQLLMITFAYQLAVSFILLIWPQEAEISFTLISLVMAVRMFGYLKTEKIIKFAK